MDETSLGQAADEITVQPTVTCLALDKADAQFVFRDFHGFERVGPGGTTAVERTGKERQTWRVISVPNYARFPVVVHKESGTIIVIEPSEA